jgi:hypothetical protein
MNVSRLMERFLADSKVQDFLQLDNDINIFSILEIDEQRHNNLLAWLLDPRGSHRHGDIYLRALLYTAVASMSDDEYYSIFARNWNYTALEWLQLNNAVVLREVTLDESNRIDLVINDCDSGICFFIESKITAPYDGDQLERYQKLVEKKFSEVEYPVFVFLHPDANKAALAKTPWHGLSYEWFIHTIEKRLHHDIPDTNQTDHLLDQLVDWHADRFSFRNTVAYKDAAIHISSKHNDFLKHIRETNYKADEYLSLLIRGDDTELLYARHSDKLDYLLSFSIWQKLGEEIRTRITSYNLEFDYSAKYLIIHNKDWRQFYTNKDDGIYYLWIELYILKDSASVNDDDMLRIAIGYTSSMIKQSHLINIKNILTDKCVTIRFCQNTLSFPLSSSISYYFDDVISEINNIFHRINSISK